MRALRSSIFAGLHQPPLTTVVRDCDLNDTIESAIHRLDVGADEALTIYEIVELDDGSSVVEATAACMERIDMEAESNMAVLYHWCIGLLANGVTVILTPDPSPLTPEQIETAFEQMARDPRYNGGTVMTRSPDGVHVRLAGGNIDRPAL